MRQPWTADAEDAHRLLTDVLRSVAVARLAPGPLREHLDLIGELCGYATLPEIVAAITGVKTQDAWLAKAAATLAAGSPGSAALSHALQRRMLHASLAEVYRVELVASLTCAVRADLAEGVRALLIDKDRRPRWQPATLAEVTPSGSRVFSRVPGRRTSIRLPTSAHHSRSRLQHDESFCHRGHREHGGKTRKKEMPGLESFMG